MPSTKTLYATRDSTLLEPNRGQGKDPHNVAGVPVSDEARVLIDFEPIPAGFTSLTKALLYMKRSTGSPPTGHDTPNNGAQLIAGRITADWSEGAKGADHLYSTSNAVVWPGPATTGELSARGSQPASGWWSIDVTEIVRSWIDGSPQKGIRLRGATNADIVFDSVQASNVDFKPHLVVEYGTLNRVPTAPTELTTTYGTDGTSLTVSGKYSDPDGDTSTKVQFQLTID
jgi:hypothetical protein